MQGEEPNDFPVWFNTWAASVMSWLRQRDARDRNTERRVAALKLFTRCSGHKVAAAADKCRRETAPRGNSHRLPSVLNPPVRRNKVYVSGGYLTPVITERPTLHRNTRRRARAHTHSCSSSLLFPVVVAQRGGRADRQFLSNPTSWNECFVSPLSDRVDKRSS